MRRAIRSFLVATFAIATYAFGCVLWAREYIWLTACVIELLVFLITYIHGRIEPW